LSQYASELVILLVQGGEGRAGRSPTGRASARFRCPRFT